MVETRIVSSPQTFPISENLEVRVYPDTRPNNLEIKNIHKGLVLVYKGQEVVGEGAGLGVPVVKYRDKTYFPGNATVSISLSDADGAREITKTFTLDTVSTKRYRDGSPVNDRLYHVLDRLFTKFYLTCRPLRPLFIRMMEMRGATGITTKFVNTEPRGRVRIVYNISPKTIDVSVNLSDIEREGCEEIVLLNEQSSRFFTVYSDSTGLRLTGRDIGPMDLVSGDHASLSNRSGSLSYRLTQVKGVSLYRGWERIGKRLEWAGLNYVLRPEASSFTYTINVKTKKDTIVEIV